MGYLSTWSISGKQHCNPPRDRLGERRPYANHRYSVDADQVVLVERQADAITFGGWDFLALAVAGIHVSDDLLSSLRKHRRVFVTLDKTPEALQKNREIARLGSCALIPCLPDGVKDANDCLSDAFKGDFIRIGTGSQMIHHHTFKPINQAIDEIKRHWLGSRFLATLL